MNKFVIAVLILSGIARSVAAYETDMLPHASKKAQQSYQNDYKYADLHRAFALASGGAWSWKSGFETVELAKESALETCSKYTQQKCILYAVDDRVVFNNKIWSESWGPYKTSQQVHKAKTGTLVDQKFYDVVFTDPKGIKKSISDLKGKTIFVHFWASWCPSCRQEFSTLIDMYKILKDIMGDKVEFVVLQVRESIDTSNQWVKQHKLTALPLSDSGFDTNNQMTLKTGTKIKDRTLAKVFPASYVLDKNGIVIFSHMGSIDDWSEYIPFFKDAVERSGK